MANFSCHKHSPGLAKPLLMDERQKPRDSWSPSVIKHCFRKAWSHSGVFQNVEMERKPARGQNLLAINYSAYLLFHLFIIPITTGTEPFPILPFTTSILPEGSNGIFMHHLASKSAESYLVGLKMISEKL